MWTGLCLSMSATLVRKTHLRGGSWEDASWEHWTQSDPDNIAGGHESEAGGVEAEWRPKLGDPEATWERRPQTQPIA